MPAIFCYMELHDFLLQNRESFSLGIPNTYQAVKPEQILNCTSQKHDFNERIFTFCGKKPPVTGGTPTQGTGNAENILMSWRWNELPPIDSTFPLCASTGLLGSLWGGVTRLINTLTVLSCRESTLGKYICDRTKTEIIYRTRNDNYIDEVSLCILLDKM